MIRLQTCPVCDNPLASEAGAGSEFFPFCCERCRLVDFYRWCEGKYAIVEPFDSGPAGDETGLAGD